jgi:hypothetical protein
VYHLFYDVKRSANFLKEYEQLMMFDEDVENQDDDGD